MGDRMPAPLGWKRVVEDEPARLTVMDLAVALVEGGLLLTDGESEVHLDEVGSPAAAARAYRLLAEAALERAREMDRRDPSRPKGWT